MKIKNGDKWPGIDVSQFEPIRPPRKPATGVTLYLVSNSHGLYGCVMDTELLFVTPYYEVAGSYFGLGAA